MKNKMNKKSGGRKKKKKKRHLPYLFSDMFYKYMKHGVAEISIPRKTNAKFLLGVSQAAGALTFALVTNQKIMRFLVGVYLLFSLFLCGNVFAFQCLTFT